MPAARRNPSLLGYMAARLPRLLDTLERMARTPEDLRPAFEAVMGGRPQRPGGQNGAQMARQFQIFRLLSNQPFVPMTSEEFRAYARPAGRDSLLQHWRAMRDSIPAFQRAGAAAHDSAVATLHALAASLRSDRRVATNLVLLAAIANTSVQTEEISPLAAWASRQLPESVFRWREPVDVPETLGIPLHR